jgi:hypothetical protein
MISKGENILFTESEYDVLIHAVKKLDEEETVSFVRWAEQMRIGETLVSLVLNGHMEPKYESDDYEKKNPIFMLTEEGQKLQDAMKDEEANIEINDLLKKLQGIEGIKDER